MRKRQTAAFPQTSSACSCTSPFRLIILSHSAQACALKEVCICEINIVAFACVLSLSCNSYIQTTIHKIDISIWPLSSAYLKSSLSNLANKQGFRQIPLPFTLSNEFAFCVHSPRSISKFIVFSFILKDRVNQITHYIYWRLPSILPIQVLLQTSSYPSASPL